MFYRDVYRNIIFPTYHYIKRDNLLKKINELKLNQWKSFEDNKKVQLVKLHKLLTHAYKNVPYYKNIIKKYGLENKNLYEYKNFRKLPVLTKQDIRNNIFKLKSVNFKGNVLYGNSTSGSTGEPLYFFTDKRTTIYRKAAVIVCQEWVDFYIGDKQISIWGAILDQNKAKTIRGKLHGIITGNKFLSSFDLTPKNMDKYAKIIEHYKPELLLSYPGPLEVFAEYIKKKNIHFPNIKCIITSAEELFLEQRKIIEEAFGAKVYNRYGSREMGLIAQECTEQNGLHIDMSRIFLEILDENGKRVSPGNLGEIFVTDLNNYGFPMIRYKIDDRALLSFNGCRCGRRLPIISKVEGRSLDIVKTKENKKLGGTFWTILFRSRKGIRKFQVIQENLSGITVYYIPEKDFSKESLLYYEKEIKNKCGKDFGIKFIKKDLIEKTSSGKHRIVISKC